MNTRSGHWSFTGPAGMVPGQQATVNDEGKARSVADGIFEQMNARAARSQGLPRLFQTDVLKFATAMPHISPSTRELVAWDVNYRMELRPSRDEEPVPVEELGIHLRISTQGILQQLHYNLLPIKTEQKTQRLQVGNALAQGSAETEETDPAIVYRPAPGKVVPYYLYAHRTDGGDLALYYPACKESPEVPRAVPAVAQKEPDTKAEPLLNGEFSFSLYLIPHEAYTSCTPELLQEMADIIIDNIYQVWNGLTFKDANGTQTVMNVCIDYVPGPLKESINAFDKDMIITVDDTTTDPDTGAETSIPRITRSYSCRGFFEGFFARDSILDLERNVPAHEFGHMLGLEDRYHYYQHFESEQLFEINTDAVLTLATPQDKAFVSVAMVLPGSYDAEYDFRDNLMSAPHRCPVTKKQLEIVMRRKLEVLPVNQFTLLGANDYNGFLRGNPQPGLCLLVTNDNGTRSFATTDIPTNENPKVLCYHVNGEKLYKGENDFSDVLVNGPNKQNADSSWFKTVDQQAFIKPTPNIKIPPEVISSPSQNSRPNLRRLIRQKKLSLPLLLIPY